MHRCLIAVILGVFMGQALFAEPSGSSGSSGPKELRWAADPNSGVPYVFADPKGAIIGFEVDIIHAIAECLGRKAVFIGNNFDCLIPGLRRGLYDVVINGLPLLPTGSPGVLYTDPYFLSYGQLVVRQNETTIQHFDDLENRKIGTYRNWKGGISIKPIEGLELRRYAYEVNAYEDLLHRRIDAVLLDFPESAYYTALIKGLKMVGPPLGNLEYGMVVSDDHPELLEELNAAIKILTQTGVLQGILVSWKLWNPRMEAWLGPYTATEEQTAHYEKTIASQNTDTADDGRVVRYIGFLPILLEAAITTLLISLLSMLLALTLGLFLAIVRVYWARPFSLLASMIIEALRGTPLLIQLYLIFYGLPHLGIKLPPILAGILGLGLNYMAYEAENYRAGLIAIPKGQMEAARALGMSHFQALRHVMIPQAIRIVIPPITNDFISLIKDSSLLSVITIVELTETYTQLANAHYDFLGLGLIFAVLYLLMGLPFVLLARRAERKGGSRVGIRGAKG